MIHRRWKTRRAMFTPSVINPDSRCWCSWSPSDAGRLLIVCYLYSPASFLQWVCECVTGHVHVCLCRWVCLSLFVCVCAWAWTLTRGYQTMKNNLKKQSKTTILDWYQESERNFIKTLLAGRACLFRIKMLSISVSFFVEGWGLSFPQVYQPTDNVSARYLFTVQWNNCHGA